MLSARVPRFKLNGAFLPLISSASSTVQSGLVGEGCLSKQFPWVSPSVLAQDLIFQKFIVIPPQTRRKRNSSSTVAENLPIPSSPSELQLRTGVRSSGSAGF